MKRLTKHELEVVARAASNYPPGNSGFWATREGGPASTVLNRLGYEKAKERG